MTLILSTDEDLKRLFKEAVEEIKTATNKEEKLPETLSVNQAVNVLKENGFPTSKAKIYKLTADNKIPHKIYNSKLIFFRKELLEWANSQIKSKDNSLEIRKALSKSSRRRL